MAKTKISEFSTTPGNNTDINGINIAEGCAPSGINNAIRELMSDLKEWQSGAMDVYVIPQGTAAAPGIQLYGDLDTGLYGYAANQLGIAVGGASAGYFSSAGWVGNVNGTITGDINATTIDTTNLEVTNIKAKDGTAAITIADSTGVVSVSTTLDLTTVEVTNIKAKDGTAAIALTDSTGVVTLARTTSATNSVNEMLVLEHYSTGTISAGFGSGIKFFGENTGGGGSVYAAIHAVWEGGIGDPSGGALVFLTDGYIGDNTERVRITSEGKVGIGTATPSTTLEVAGSATVTGAATLSATTQNIALGTSQTTGTWTAGGASQTGALTLDQSTKTHTLNLGTGATENALTKTINIGTAGVSGSTTTITIGSTNGTTTTLNGTVTAATFNSTTIDTTNIEVTNIKAKDGTAALSIADSTGAVTVATAFAANGGVTLGDASGDSLTINSSAVSTPNGLNFDSNTFVIDATNNRVGVGEASPGFKLDVKTASGGDGIRVTSAATAVINLHNNNQTSGAVQIGQGFATGTDNIGYIFNFSNADLVFGTNGTSKMRITSGGQVNIGGNFTSTNNTLQVTGNAAIGYTAAAPTTGLIVAGTVGIGRTAAVGSEVLSVNGMARIETEIDIIGGAGTPEVRLYQNTSNWSIRNSTGSLDFYNLTGSATKMLLDSSGNLGLGVTPDNWSAIVAFQVGNGASLHGFGVDEATLSANTYYNGGYKYAASSFATQYQQQTGKHQWFTAPSGTAGNAISFTQAMTLDASGNLGVGTPNPLSKLDVAGGSIRVNEDGVGTKIITIRSDFAGLGPAINVTVTQPLLFLTSNTERARITSGGYFKASNDGTYYGSTGSQHELRNTANGEWVVRAVSASATDPNGMEIRYSAATPNGTTNRFLYCPDATALRAEIRSNGGLANYQSNNVDLSDIRTKTDINPLGSYWNKIAALEIVTYKYKDQTHDDLNIGVIAQQVEQVAPEFVDADGFGETPEDGVPLKTIYNKDLMFAAIKALQEAMARIEKLEAEVAALKGV